MPDLLQILASAERQVDATLDRSGCRVSLRRPNDAVGAPVDPDTLAVNVTAAAPYATGRPAIVAPAGGESDGLPARSAARQGARVILRDEDARQVLPRDEVVVTTSRDAALVGAVFAVDEITRSSVGIVASLSCSPVGAL